jgi:hypothetical protein
LEKLRSDNLNKAECDIVRNITDVELLSEIVSNSPDLLYELIVPTPDVCLLAVQKNPYALGFIDDADQSLEVVLAAVKVNGGAIRCVTERLLTYQVCEAAIFAPFSSRMSPFDALNRFHSRWIEVLNKNPALCKAEVQNHDAFDLGYMEQTAELCELAVKRNKHALQCVKPEFQTLEMCRMAIQEYGKLLMYVTE